MHRSVELIEPEPEAVEESLCTLVQALCIDARADRVSPHYLFAFEQPSRVENVRRFVNARELGRWEENDSQITLPGGHAVLVGRLEQPCSLVRSVVLCSGGFPDRATLRVVAASVRLVLIADPREPVKDAAMLRQFASLAWELPSRRED